MHLGWPLFIVVLTLVLTPAHAEQKIRIGTEGAYPPFNYFDQNGGLRGFDVDIARALCEKMGAECEFVVQNWKGMIPALRQGRFDAIVASMSITEERARQVDFTDPYYTNKLQFVASENAGIEVSRKGLEGKTLGAQLGTISQLWLEQNLGEAARIKLYDIQELAYLDLVAGRLDAVLADMLVSWAWLRTEAGRGFALLGDPVLEEDKIAIAVRKGDDELRTRFNRALEAIRADGAYQKINARYFPFSIY